MGFHASRLLHRETKRTHTTEWVKGAKRAALLRGHEPPEGLSPRLLCAITDMTDREVIVRQTYPIAPALRHRSREPVSHVVVCRRRREPGLLSLVVKGTIGHDKARCDEALDRDGLHFVCDEEVALQTKLEIHGIP